MNQDNALEGRKRSISSSVPLDKTKKSLFGIMTAAMFVLAFIAATSAFAQVNRQDLNAGETLEVNCNGNNLQIDTLSRTSVNITCQGENNPPPNPTNTPAPPQEPTAVPPTPTPNPNPPGDSSPYGVFPDCIAPAVGLETHSWWHEDGERAPRHVHIATCLPNARATDGGGVVVREDMKAVFRVMAFNNPGEVEWVRYQWQGNTQETRRVDQQCQSSPDEFKECTWYYPFTVDIDAMNVGGMDELRMSPNIQNHDLGTRQFPTLNFQIHRGGSGNYRSSEEPIARSWYPQTSYVRAHWSNYMDLFTSLDQSAPAVSGTINLDVKHSKSGGNCIVSHGFIDPAFHAFHAGNAPEPQPFYSKTGCFSGTVQLDTSQLSNGRHTVYLQTQVQGSSGLNAGAMAYFINVQN